MDFKNIFKFLDELNYEKIDDLIKVDFINKRISFTFQNNFIYIEYIINPNIKIINQNDNVILFCELSLLKDEELIKRVCNKIYKTELESIPKQIFND